MSSTSADASRKASAFATSFPISPFFSGDLQRFAAFSIRVARYLCAYMLQMMILLPRTLLECEVGTFGGRWAASLQA